MHMSASPLLLMSLRQFRFHSIYIESICCEISAKRDFFFYAVFVAESCIIECICLMEVSNLRYLCSWLVADGLNYTTKNRLTIPQRHEALFLYLLSVFLLHVCFLLSVHPSIPQRQDAAADILSEQPPLCDVYTRTWLIGFISPLGIYQEISLQAVRVLLKPVSVPHSKHFRKGI